jgi:hypothetical protein
MSGNPAAPRQNAPSLASALDAIDQNALGGPVSSAPATAYRSDYAVKPVGSLVLRPQSIKEFIKTPHGRLAALAAAAAFALGGAVGLLGLAPLHDAHSGARSGRVVVATQREVLPAPSCLLDRSQTVQSEVRDQLLLDAAKAYETGNPEQALEMLRRYTNEACDRATLDAVGLLERQLRAAKKEH